MDYDREIYHVGEEPEEDDGGSLYQIRRVPAGGSLNLVLISKNVLGIRTHYYHGRTTPCLRANCPACNDGYNPRWHGYVLAVDARAERPIIFEFPAGVWPTFKQYANERGDLRGVMAVATRLGSANNSPVQVTLRGPHKEAHRLPPEQDLWPILCRIFGLRPSAETSSPGTGGDSLSESEHADVRAPRARRVKKIVRGETALHCDPPPAIRPYELDELENNGKL